VLHHACGLSITALQDPVGAHRSHVDRLDGTAKQPRVECRRSVGVIVSNFENPFFLDIYKVVEAGAGIAGFEITMANTGYSPERLAAIFMGMLNSRGYFFIPALGATMLNVVMICSVLFLAPQFGKTLETQIFGLAVGVLVAGLGVALLSSVIPYSLDLEALRKIPPRVFGILMSLEPAMAALVGLIVLHESLHRSQWIAVLCVVAASVGAKRGARPYV
jgi:EamA domain-containing membrane protein RarD